MIRKSLFLALILTAFALSVFGQQARQVASVVHNLHTINSQILGEERTILVRLPPNYARGGEKFPVVYMLDAHPPQNAMMAGIIEQQVWGGMMPEMILVGIQNTDRTRDLTPTKTERGGGGGDKFLQFIETEVMPMVEKNYRTQPFRIFAGHSLGGLTVVYAFLTRPEMFNGYIAASPSLVWDNNFVINRAEETFRQRKEYKKTMFLALGNEPQLQKGFNSFKDLLARAKLKDFEYEFRQMNEENHGSIVLPAYYWGLRKIFDGWEVPSNGSVEDLENHYKKLSARFGYTIPVPEETLNSVGYQFLRGNKTIEAIEVFRKNVVLYPNSANVYDSLAEAYEKNGQLKQARENYEKAYKMAEARGEAQLAKSAKDNFERISSKIE